MRHFQALVQIDSSDPPGNETRVAEYVKKTLEAEGIPVMLVAKDPARANIIARLKGNGSKRPLLIMGHSDVVRVDPAKWTFPPFSATRQGGYVYGRGTLDDKSDLLATMMTMLMLKRQKTPLDRDVIFVSEAGEEASTGPGIEYLVNEHWNDIDAEFCLAESGGVRRKNGQARYALVETTEKQPKGARLVANGPSGHGSRPLRTNAVVHLAKAVETIAAWDPPMRFNDTTRYYFEKMATGEQSGRSGAVQGAVRFRKGAGGSRVSGRARSRQLLHAAHLHFAQHHQGRLSGERDSVGSGGDARHPRAAGREHRRVLRHDAQGDQRSIAIELVPETRNQRPGAAPSRLDRTLIGPSKQPTRSIYGVITIPLMQTGATDMAFLRAKGVQCYGVGAMVDEEDAPKGYGPHSDQERILEQAVYKHVQFFWQAVNIHRWRETLTRARNANRWDRLMRCEASPSLHRWSSWYRFSRKR